MYLRAIGRGFTQMIAYFLVMNSKRCITTFTRKFLKPAQACKVPRWKRLSRLLNKFLIVNSVKTLIQLTMFYLAWMFYSITLTYTSACMWPSTIHRKKPSQIRSLILYVSSPFIDKLELFHQILTFVLGTSLLLMRSSKISHFWMVESRRQLDAWNTYFAFIIYFHISTYSYSSRTLINTAVQGTLNIAYIIRF